MKKITLNLLALLVTCCMWQVSAQSGTTTASDAGAPQSWSDGTTGLVSTMTADLSAIPAGALVTDVNVSLDVDHSWAGDLDITLTSPDLTDVLILDSSCSLQDNISAIFDDAGGAIPCASSSTPAGHETCPGNYAVSSTVFGTVMPSNPLSAFNSDNAAGDWILTIVDNVGGDGGCAQPFTIEVSWSVPPPPGAECSVGGAVIAPGAPGVSYDVIIPVAAMGTIGENSFEIEMESVFLDMFQHDAANELQVSLTAPDGVTTAMLFFNDGGTDGLDVAQAFGFEDGGSNVDDWNDALTFNPPFQAESGPFNGEMGVGTFQGVDITGDWTLTILNGGGSGGSLAQACINFQDRGLVGTVPTISCPMPNPFVVDAEPGLCSAEVVFADAAGADAEDGPLTAVRTDMTGLNSGDQFPVGTTVISFEVTDSDGNTAACDFIVTVNDAEAPTVTCADPITVGNDLGDCGAIVMIPAPEFMDNCSIDPADISNDYNAQGANVDDFFTVGTTTVTYSYTDSGMNTITCSVDVTVEDTEAPEIVCEGGLGTVTATETTTSGAVIINTAPPAVSTLTVADDFEITDLNIDLDITHTWVGDLDITLTSPAGTVVTVFDGSADGCSANDITTTLDDESANSLGCPPGMTNSDAFPLDDYMPNSPLSAFDGESTMGDWTLTVTDNFGGDEGILNGWTLEYSYLFGAAPPYEVTLMDDGTATIDASDLLVSAMDNCTGALIVTAGGPLPTCSSGNYPDLSEINGSLSAGVPIAAIFANDFTVDAETTFFLQDFDIVLHAATGDTYSNIAFTLFEDNAGVPGTLITSEASASFTETGRIAAAGSPPRENVTLNVNVSDVEIENTAMTATTYWIGVDVTAGPSGRDGVAISTSTLTGGQMLLSQDAGATWTPYSAFTPTGTMGDGIYNVNGQCVDPSNDPTVVSFTCDNVGDNSVDVSVTDAAGNTSVCTSVVTVIDDTAPVVVCMDFTLELDDNGVATLDPNDAIDEDATVEACGYEATASQTDFSCADIGTPVVVDIFVIDPSGNVAACTATITVVDVNGPVTECPDDQTVDPEANGVYTLEDFTGLVTATDGCDGNVDVISQSPAPGTALGVGTYTITMTSTDSMGNEGTCTFELTVNQVQGVGESELSAAIALYPNPATEIVNLSNNSTIALDRAAIYNVNGQLVSDIDLDGMIGERTIDVSSLASGVYMVQVSGENNVVVKRLIIE